LRFYLIHEDFLYVLHLKVASYQVGEVREVEVQTVVANSGGLIFYTSVITLTKLLSTPATGNGDFSQNAPPFYTLGIFSGFEVPR